MQERRILIVLTLSLGLLLLGACGGAGGATVEAGQTNPDAPTLPGLPADPLPGPTPAPSPLDAQLSDLLADARVSTPALPPDRPAALVALGRALFFDKELSGNRNIACATCHHPSAGTGDQLSVSIGAGGVGSGSRRALAEGVLIPRNAPPLFNRGLPAVRQMFWDSRVRRTGGPGTSFESPEPALNGPNPQATGIVAELDSALAAQALFPLTSEAEMRGAAGTNELADAPDNLTLWARLMARLVGTENGTQGGIAGYRQLFRAAYPGVTDLDDLNIGHAARALAAYEDQAFRALSSPFDAYLAGDPSALSEQAKRGAVLFFSRAACHRCHDGPLLTDDRHHAIAVPQIGPGKDFAFEDTGRFGVTADPDDLYEFRTPSLRNVELTGPWMHDGAYTSLAAAVRHYDNPSGAARNYDASQLAPLLRTTVDLDPLRNQARADALSRILRPAPNLSPGDVADLVAFLRSLTDPRSTDLSAQVPSGVPSGLPVAD